MSPAQMTPRARAYIAITAAQHGAVGSAALLLSHQFDGDGFRVIRSLFPMWAWALVFLTGSAYLMYAAARGSEDWARLGMVVSVVLTAVWAVSFFCAYVEGGVVSPVGTVFCLSLMAKDLVVCRQPMRSPFEPLVEQYVGPRPVGR